MDLTRILSDSLTSQVLPRHAVPRWSFDPEILYNVNPLFQLLYKLRTTVDVSIMPVPVPFPEETRTTPGNKTKHVLPKEITSTTSNRSRFVKSLMARIYPLIFNHHAPQLYVKL